jgi:hypothetical protein
VVLQPRQDKSRRFGLFRFRSPLLTESILVLFLRILRCFTSPRIARTILCIQTVATPNDRCRVSPFGNLRIKACVPLPEAYRSLLRPSSPDEAKASINCCNWFMQTLTYSRRLFYPLTLKTTLNFQRTKTIGFRSNHSCHRCPTPDITHRVKWWAQMDLNHRPRAYQARALTN